MDAQTPQEHQADRQTAYCVQDIAIVAEVDSRPPTEEEKRDRVMNVADLPVLNSAYCSLGGLYGSSNRCF